jgi:hypothetical protein
MANKGKIELWIHHGKLGKTKPTLCLFHDAPGVRLGQHRKTLLVGEQFLITLAELQDEKTRPAQRVLTFRASSRKRALRKLKLKLVPVREELKVMHIGYERDSAFIEITDEGLSLLRDAFASWLKGDEDFGVSPEHSTLKPNELGKLDRESGELWFWGPGYLGP